MLDISMNDNFKQYLNGKQFSTITALDFNVIIIDLGLGK